MINKDELKNSFGNIQQNSSVQNKSLNSISNEVFPNQSEKLRLNEDSFCCYETESLSKENFDYFKSKNSNIENKENIVQTILNKVNTNGQSNGELLKDITNTYILVHESFQKQSIQNKNGDNAFEHFNESFRNHPMLQDSEKKNPLEMEFDD